MPVPSARQGYIVPYRQILRCPEAIDVIRFVKVLPEESEGCQRRFAVVEPPIEGIANLVRYGVEIIPEIPESQESPVPDRDVVEKPVGDRKSVV